MSMSEFGQISKINSFVKLAIEIEKKYNKKDKIIKIKIYVV